MTTVTEIRKQIARVGLSKHQDIIESVLQPAIRFRAAARKRLRKFGNSKLGGIPDVNSGFEWPRDKQGRPLSHLAQISLAELPGGEFHECFGSSGLLSFFCELTDLPDGEPHDFGKWCVCFQGRDSKSSRPLEAPTDLHKDGLFVESPVEFHSILTLPANSVLKEYQPHRVEFTYKEELAYDDLIEVLIPNKWRNMHQLFGHPSSIQEPVELAIGQMFSRAVHGIPEVVGTNPFTKKSMVFKRRPPQEMTPEVKQVLEGTERWHLLLQLQTALDSPQRFEWGDMGCLYFCVSERALKARRLNEAWMVFQCH